MEGFQIESGLWVRPEDAAEFLCLKTVERRIGFSPGMLLMWFGRVEGIA